MVLGPLHTLADLGDVGEDGLLVAFTHALRRWDLVALRASSGMVRVLLGQEAEESALQRCQYGVGIKLGWGCSLPGGDRIVWESGHHGSRYRFRFSYTMFSQLPARLNAETDACAAGEIVQ